MGLCVAMIAFVRLPSLKVSCLLLSGLLIYDVFWVRPEIRFTTASFQQRVKTVNLTKARFDFQNKVRIIVPLTDRSHLWLVSFISHI